MNNNKAAAVYCQRFRVDQFLLNLLWIKNQQKMAYLSHNSYQKIYLSLYPHGAGYRNRRLQRLRRNRWRAGNPLRTMSG